MIYAEVQNKKIIRYPVDVINENPNTSFRENWQGGEFENKLYAVVYNTPPPDVKIGYDLCEDLPVYDEETNQFKQTWKLIRSNHYFNLLKEYVFMKNMNAEQSGVNIDGDIFLTDRESQTKYSIYALKKIKLKCKTMNGKYVEVDSGMVDKRVTEHVEACFDVGRKYMKIIDSGDYDLIDNTDFDLGWPSNN
jgi:hypothetical protein